MMRVGETLDTDRFKQDIIVLYFKKSELGLS